MSTIHIGLDNPFIDWWQLDDSAWLAQRKKLWPHVKRYLLRRHSQMLSRHMPALRKYFVYGEVPVEPDPNPMVLRKNRVEAYAAYIGLEPRLILMPWRTPEQARRATETYVYPQDRGKGPFWVVSCGIAEALNLPLHNANDSGFKRMALAAEAFYPAEIADEFVEQCCLQRSSSREKIEEQLQNFIEEYEWRVACFLGGAEDADNQPIRANPAQRILNFYFKCFELLERRGVGEWERRRGSSVSRFLLSVMRFDECYTGVDENDARRQLALSIRRRFEKPNAPADIVARLPDVWRSDIKPVRLKKKRPNPYGHLKFFRGSGKLQYTTRVAPDSELLVAVAITCDDGAKRDRVLRLVGEPGRPASEEDAAGDDLAVYQAISALPIPNVARCPDENSVHFEWWYWEDEHVTLEPLFDAIAQLALDQAFVMTNELYDGGATRFQLIENGRAMTIDDHSSPVFQRARKWFLG